MKSAEEWASERWNQFEKGKSLIEYYKQIQLDAIKEGMTRAANLSLSFIGDVCNDSGCDRCEQNKFIAKEILAASDSLKELA